MTRKNLQMENGENELIGTAAHTRNILKRNVILFYAIYILFNALIVFKYGTRQHYINAWLLSMIYVIFLVFVLIINVKIKLKENVYKYLFFGLGALFFIFAIWLNTHVDKYGLKVDRWSAMEVCIKSLINDIYPYSAIDHLQGRSSNLPALIFIGMPFYLLGDVGYLQCFTFLLMLVLIYIYFKTYRVRVWALLTIVFSTAYCYDIYVKSDIVSNFILTLVFVVLSEQRFRKDKKADIVFNAVGSALLIMTRIVTVIPLILLLFRRFLKMSTKAKWQFMVVFFLIITVTCAVVFKNVGSMDNFMNYNPFYLQNSQLPFLLSLFCILIPFLFSFYIKNTEVLIKYCIIFLLLPVLLSLVAKTIEFDGLYNSILGSRFDISYFNFVNPFLIFYLAILFDKLAHYPGKHT